MKKSIENVLGTKMDKEIAAEHGLSVVAVYRLRRKLGIPACKHAARARGNRTDRRGHRPAGKSTNDLTPEVRRLLSDLQQFLAARKAPAGIKNPYSRTRCAATCGMSSTALRQYLEGIYVPGPDQVAALTAWLASAKKSAP